MTDTECLEKIGPFIKRLIKPRYDKYETNDYINESSDCKNAILAYQEWSKNNKPFHTDPKKPGR